MRRFWIGVGLLASAFSPLLVALALVLRPLPSPWWIVLAVAFALPVLLLPAVWRSLRRLGGAPLDVRSVASRDDAVLGFLASYLIPIVVVFFGPPDPPRLVAMLVLLAVLVAVYVRAELYWLNPFLSVAGFRVYSVTTEGGGSVILVTRRRELFAGERLVDVREFSPGIRVEVGGR
jgi:hypothetical protein